MSGSGKLRSGLSHSRLKPGSQQAVIQLRLHFRGARNRRKGALIRKPIVQSAQIFDRALQKADGKARLSADLADVLDTHLVKTRSERLDGIER